MQHEEGPALFMASWMRNRSAEMPLLGERGAAALKRALWRSIYRVRLLLFRLTACEHLPVIFVLALALSEGVGLS